MATQTGTATDYLDLLEKLRVFLTTGLASGQNWTVLKDSTEGRDRVLYFRAPGLAASDQIYTIFNAYKNVGSDYYNWGVHGATGHNASDAYTAQPGISQQFVVPLWNSSISYWFVANGRRVIVFAKVSTVYVCCYAGFFIPHGLPSEYPYPLAVGGMHYVEAKRWSVTDPAFKAFWNPAGDSSPPTQATLGLREPGGSWRLLANFGNTGDTGQITGSNVWPYTQFSDQKQVFGGTTDYLLMPVLMHTSLGGGNVFGELDGIYAVSGFGNASENTMTISSINYVVFQNAFRTSLDHYCALKME